MKLKLLIATSDSDYAQHLSNALSEKYADAFEVSVCSQAERLRELLLVNKFDVALFETGIEVDINAHSIHLPLALFDDSETVAESHSEYKKIRKYQKISSIVGDVLQNYAELGAVIGSFNAADAKITAVWSPMGGSGKTTVALAFAAYKVSVGKQAVYLNLENFSSASTYFKENGKSISKVFEKLESNVQLFLAGIRQHDGDSGVFYFCGPENYDDINILTIADIQTLISGCAKEAEELVIDLSSQCDERIQKIFEIADNVILVCDNSPTSKIKLNQFINQHNVFGKIKDKTVLANNKGVKSPEMPIDVKFHLPLVQTSDPKLVFKTLSGVKFDW